MVNTIESAIVLDAQDSVHAMFVHKCVGYRVIGLAIEGAYSPVLDDVGTLTLGPAEAEAINECIKEVLSIHSASKENLHKHNPQFTGQRAKENNAKAVNFYEAKIAAGERLQGILEGYLGYLASDAEMAETAA